MKFIKGISLFFIYPVVMLAIGFGSGIIFMDYFYPGEGVRTREEADVDWNRVSGTVEQVSEKVHENSSEDLVENSQEYAQTAFLDGRLNADTRYVLEETDIRSRTVVETTWKLPAKYIGLNREQFIEVMEDYEASPPLSELERGFVSLEVLAFSQEKVVVQMNYEYTQPSDSFYIKVENNYIVVYLDDQTTRYMDTDISLLNLPDGIQQDIINVMYVPDEESLYDFLETYSS